MHTATQRMSRGSPFVFARALSWAAPRGLGTGALLSWIAALMGCSDSTGAVQVASVVVAPGSATLTAIGATVQLVASVRDASGNAISGFSVAWVSSNEGVVTVSASGLVTAVGNGTAAVTGAANGVSASAVVTVAQAVAVVTVTPPVDTLVSIGETVQLSAQAADANGHTVGGVSFTWSSSGPSIVQVSVVGLARGVSNGSATITAAAGSVGGGASVVVDQVATQLRFQVQPTRTITARVMSPAPEVVIADALGTAVDDATGLITVVLATNPGGGTLAGTLTASATAGRAVFDDIAIDRAGAGYTLRASSGALAATTSTPFDVAPEPVTLSALTKTTNAITIEWSQSAEPNFASYVVLRSEDAQGAGVAHDTITVPSGTVFRDSSAVLGVTYYYWVEVVARDGVKSASNRNSIEAGIAIDLGTVPARMLPDPARSVLYVVSRNTNRLLFVDVSTRTVVKSIFAGMDPTDLDMDATGDTLFVVSFGTNKVFVVDLATRDTVRSLSFPDPGNHSQGAHYHIAAGRSGRAYYVDARWDPWIHVLDTDAGVEIGAFYFDGIGDVEASSDGGTLYVWRQFGWGAGIINSWVTRVDASTDNLTVSQAGATNIGRDPLDTPVLLAVTDSRVYTKKWAFKAADLDIIEGAFPQDIYAVAPDGSLVFSESTIYDGATGVAIRPLPRSSRLLTISADGSILFIHAPGSGRIFLYDLSPF